MEQWNIGTMGWRIDRLSQYSNIPVLHHSIGPPEASAGGRSLRLSAHGRLHTCGWAEGSWLPGIVRGEGYRSLP